MAEDKNKSAAPSTAEDTTVAAAAPVAMQPTGLPPGAVLATEATALITPGGGLEQSPSPSFKDEHVGIGGNYVVGDDGVRRRVYEEYKDDNGMTQYRPQA